MIEIASACPEANGTDAQAANISIGASLNTRRIGKPLTRNVALHTKRVKWLIGKAVAVP